MHKPSLLIIDALNLIRRIYAVEEKQHVSDDALIRSCKARVHNATKKMLKLMHFNYACAVLDGRDSWRYQFYPLYKANRQPMPERLKQNLDVICEGFNQAGVFVYTPYEDEADDIIATLTHKSSAAGLFNVIASTDKGFLTLLDESVAIFDYFQQRYLNDDYVVDKYMVNKSQFIEYLALIGDKTNNIPGVKGVGKQSTVELLNKYGSIDVALSSADPSIKKTLLKIEKDINNLVISRALLTLRTDIALGINLKDIRISNALVAEQ